MKERCFPLFLVETPVTEQGSLSGAGGLGVQCLLEEMSNCFTIECCCLQVIEANTWFQKDQEYPTVCSSPWCHKVNL